MDRHSRATWVLHYELRNFDVLGAEQPNAARSWHLEFSAFIRSELEFWLQNRRVQVYANTPTVKDVFSYLPNQSDQCDEETQNRYPERDNCYRKAKYEGGRGHATC